MFYGMKPRYKLSGRVFDMMKYKRINNKKSPGTLWIPRLSSV